MTESGPERELLRQLSLLRLPPPVRELPFAKEYGRAWRIDFAWPEKMLAVELDSSVHRIKSRFRADLEKSAALYALGWDLLRVSPEWVRTGAAVRLIAAALSSGRSGVKAALIRIDTLMEDR